MRSVFAEELPKFGIESMFLQPSEQTSLRLKRKSNGGLTVLTLPALRVSGGPLRRLPAETLNAILILCFVLKAIRELRPSIFWVRNDWWALVTLWGMSKITGIPLCYQESFPLDEADLISSRKRGLGGIMVRALITLKVRIRTHIARKSALVLPVSEAMTNEFRRRRVPEGKLMTLPLGVPPGFAPCPELAVRIREKYKLHGKFVILYVGTLAEIRKPEIMVDAFEIARAMIPNAIFMLVGGTEKEIQLVKSKRGVVTRGSYLFVGMVPHQEVASYIYCADVGLSIIPPLPIYGVSSPTKVVEMMAVGVPIVANSEIPDQEDLLIHRSDVARLCKFEVKDIARALIEVAELPIAKDSRKSYLPSSRNYANIAKMLKDRLEQLS
jgi:glycosyltransferase involved in cell wall biosynthesis